MKSRKPVLTVSLLLGAAFLLQSCFGDLPFGTREVDHQSRVRVLVTDAPAVEVAKAWVTIHQVELLDLDGVATTLSDESHTFDLLTLQNGETLQLANVLVDQGTYRELRIVVDEEAEVELVGGETMKLKIPSGHTSGIKVKFNPFTVDEETDEFELTADFDFSRSFVQAGNSGKVIFKPVIKAKSMKQDGEPVAVPEEEN